MTKPARVTWTRAGSFYARPCAGPSGSAEARERGNELRRVDRAPAAGQVVAPLGGEAGDAAEGVVAGGDVHDAVAAAGRAERAHHVERGVDQAEPVTGRLVGEHDDAREDRRRLAGAADEVPADADAAEGRVDPGGPVYRGAHRDVRRTALAADLLGHAGLVDRPREDAGHAAATGPVAVVPHHVGR